MGGETPRRHALLSDSYDIRRSSVPAGMDCSRRASYGDIVMAQAAVRRPSGRMSGEASFKTAPPRRLRSVLVPLLILAVAAAPVLVPPGPGNSVPLDVINVVLIPLGAIALWRSRANLRLPLAVPYLLVLAGGLLGVTRSIVPSDSMFVLLQDVYLFAWFIIATNVVLSEGESVARLMAIAWSFIGVTMGAVVWLVTLLYPDNVLYLFGYRTVDEFNRSEATFRDPNMAASYLALSLFVLWASPRPHRTWARAALSVPIILGVYATQSITGIVVLVAGTAIALTLGLIRNRRTAVALAIGMVSIALAVVGALPEDAPRRTARAAQALGRSDTFHGSLGRANSSLAPRMDRLEDALLFFGNDLMTGIGPGATDDSLQAFNAPIEGELHNDYIAGFVERGIVGGIGVVALFMAMGWWGIRVGFSRSLSRLGWQPAALSAATAVVLLSGLSLEILHFRHVWLYLALLCALGSMGFSRRALE